MTISAFSTIVPALSSPKAKRTDVGMNAREPADVQFQAEHAAALPRAIEFFANLIDQGFDDGEFVHGAVKGRGERERGEGEPARPPSHCILYLPHFPLPSALSPLP